ncbi:MAG: FAD-dependent oxidoreductase [Chloroflexota bacterium]
MKNDPQKIAVIGGGVAGIVSAYLLSRKFDVTLIEAADYVWGHTNTITIEEGPDAGTPVDTGFIVLNTPNYPNFREFLRQLNVPTRQSEMSFSFYCRDTNLAYSSHVPNGLFAQRRNLLRPSFLAMIRDILRFNRQVLQELEAGQLQQLTLGDYLHREGYTAPFIEHHLKPAAAAIWSTPPEEVLAFPIESFVHFFNNHGLLQLYNRPQWSTVVGGSHSYVKAFLKQFSGTVLKSAPVIGVQRHAAGVEVTFKDQTKRQFDKVVIATHADQALRLLRDPSPDEQALLGVWDYHQNDTILHTDTTVMSPNRRVWASWNYVRHERIQNDQPVTMTYYMNRLQGLKTANHYFVTLNNPTPIPEQHIIKRIQYTHPNYTFDSMASQTKLPSLNGQQNTYFCGSYFGYGFHEDAVKSAVAVGKALGVELRQDVSDVSQSSPIVGTALTVPSQ